jgi:hypothetical protein
MAIQLKYVLPLEQTQWAIHGETNTVLQWDYDDTRDRLVQLYDKAKKQQWNASERIDWKQDLDPDNPMGLPDQFIGIYGSKFWDKMNEKERANLRRHAQAWQISQLLHGEQGALVCSAKIVQQVPDIDSKLYAATQTIDEARHVEAYSRLLTDKFEIAYPITSALKALLENVIEDSRWDFTFLGMQVLIEGLALAVFQRLRDQASNGLAAAVNAYVMQDESRHVAFGRLALREFYPQITEQERAEREEFVVDACYNMRDRFLSPELWESMGLPVKECLAIMSETPLIKQYRVRLFSRIVPTIKDIGLWGEKVQKAFASMGVIELANVNTDAVLENDNRVAEEFDARKQDIQQQASSAAD